MHAVCTQSVYLGPTQTIPHALGGYNSWFSSVTLANGPALCKHLHLSTFSHFCSLEMFKEMHTLKYTGAHKLRYAWHKTWYMSYRLMSQAHK